MIILVNFYVFFIHPIAILPYFIIFLQLQISPWTLCVSWSSRHTLNLSLYHDIVYACICSDYGRFINKINAILMQIIILLTYLSKIINLSFLFFHKILDIQPSIYLLFMDMQLFGCFLIACIVNDSENLQINNWRRVIKMINLN